MTNTLHLSLCFLLQRRMGGVLGVLLKKFGQPAALQQAVDELRAGQSVDDPNAEASRQALDKYTIDMTERAESGKLDPVIGTRR
jgi:ATP-dependent Clp protease ATP-binding subunit ClpB